MKENIYIIKNGMEGYDENGNIIYELKNGKGKEYNYNGNLIFEGEYINGKRWNGKIFDNIYYILLYLIFLVLLKKIVSFLKYELI